MSKNKNEIAKVILKSLALGSLVVVSLALPGLPAAFAPFMKSKKFKQQQLKRSLQSLEKQQLVYIKEKEGKTEIKITKGGREKLLRFKLDEMTIKKQKKWDRRFRLVIFDIPVRFSRNRLAFTRKLYEMGFKLIQKSVWVYPFPCEDEIDFLKEVFTIRHYVRVVTAEKLDIQQDLMKKFELT